MKTTQTILCGILAVALMLAFTGCYLASAPLPGAGGDPGGATVTFDTSTPLTADGNATATTTEITFTLSEAIAGLTADDITLTGVAGVTKGTLSGAGPTYTLGISGFTEGGTLTVTITKTGYTISGSQTVTIYYYSGAPHTHTYSATWSFDETEHWKECTAGDGAKDSDSIANHTGNPCTVCGYDSGEPTVTFSSVTQNGNATTTTTELTLTFSAAIIGLSADDITLSGAASVGVSKGALSGSGPTYTLPISGVTTGGTLSVAVAKAGYNISGSHTVTIHYYSGGGGGGGGDEGHTHTYAATWSTNATQHWHECSCGDKTDVANHTYDATFVCTVCGYEHTHTYSATWSFDATQHWHECIANDGAKGDAASHTGDPCSVCNYDSGEPLVTFDTNNPLTANGSATTTTTELTFTLSAAIPGLSASDITLSGVTGVSKGTLTGAGPTYTLPISGFTTGGTLTVTVAKTGYNISGSHTVTIYYVKTDSDTFVLGETGPGGGKIFYYDPDGFTVQMVDSTQNYTAHYLEAAPANITSRSWASASYQTTSITGTSHAIGTGRKNTALILATDATAPAAKACNDYNNGGKTDWFLPSRYELNELYVNRASVGNMVVNIYWTSTQYDNSSAYITFFDDGHVYSGQSKYTNVVVRAVRAF